MNFIKYFKQLFEGFFDLNSIRNWKIYYYHNNEHNLEDRIKKRTNLNEEIFNDFLYKVVEVSEIDNLNGDWVFVSFKYSFKIIIDIENTKNKILIITILGPNEKTKETKNIKVI